MAQDARLTFIVFDLRSKHLPLGILKASFRLPSLARCFRLSVIDNGARCKKKHPAPLTFIFYLLTFNFSSPNWGRKGGGLILRQILRYYCHHLRLKGLGQWSGLLLGLLSGQALCRLRCSCHLGYRFRWNLFLFRCLYHHRQNLNLC